MHALSQYEGLGLGNFQLYAFSFITMKLFNNEICGQEKSLKRIVYGR